MKVLFIILVVYLVVSVIGFLIALGFNGKGDQSKQPKIDLLKESFKWPVNLLKFLGGLL